MIFLTIVPFLLLIYLYIRRKYSYWSDRGIDGPRPIFPFGYLYSRALSTPHSMELGWQAKYGQVYGVYSGLIPTLTISDPALIKEVLVKNFHLYMNRRSLNSYHELWNNNLFYSESATWKRIRSIATPAFTSGKLRGMVPLMKKCVDRFDTYLEAVTQTDGTGKITPKDVCAGLTIDVIASCVFATETNANNSQITASPFVKHGINLFNFNPAKMMAVFALPRSVLNFLGITTWFPDESFQFFIDLASSIIKKRQDNPEAQKGKVDSMQLMMDSFTFEEDFDENANYEKSFMDENSMEEQLTKQENGTTKSKANKLKMTNLEITSQAIFLFVAGFETSAGTLSNILFELAHNQSVQERVIAELESLEVGTDPETYSDQLLNHAPYLDAVIKETLRKYPPVIRLERRVGFDGLNLGGVPLDKGTLIEIPSLAVHMNPKYHPEPEVFNPDRFLPENKDKLVPYTYFPFGQGPRYCIGMRFALQEVKLFLSFMLKKYKFEVTEKTPKKVSFRKGQFLMNGLPFELKVSRR